MIRYTNFIKTVLIILSMFSMTYHHYINITLYILPTRSWSESLVMLCTTTI